MFQKVKSKVLALTSVLALALVGATSAFAVGESVPAVDYTEITTAITGQANSMVSAAVPMIIGVLGIGLTIFGLFLLFKFGKRAIGTATSSKG